MLHINISCLSLKLLNQSNRMAIFHYCSLSMPGPFQNICSSILFAGHGIRIKLTISVIKRNKAPALTKCILSSLHNANIWMKSGANDLLSSCPGEGAVNGCKNGPNFILVQTVSVDFWRKLKEGGEEELKLQSFLYTLLPEWKLCDVFLANWFFSITFFCVCWWIKEVILPWCCNPI